jgi:DNA-binding GntR family transcriptional regulator
MSNARAHQAPPTRAPAKGPDEGLSQTIAQTLKARIYDGLIAPGERINEAVLAQEMGISRGPIREAMRILTGLGLVTAVPNRGVFVREISWREMLELYELRALVFGFAAERACQHLEVPQQQALAQLLEQMDQAHAAQDATAYYEANLQFHAQILTLGGNQRAHQTYDDCVKSLHLFRRSHFNAPGNMKRSNAEHRAIFEAIAKGDARRARTLAERHVLSGRDRVLARLEP